MSGWFRLSDSIRHRVRPLLVVNFATEQLAITVWPRTLIPRWFHCQLKDAIEILTAEQAPNMLTLRWVVLHRREKKLQEKTFLSCLWSIECRQPHLPFGLMESKLFFPPYVQRGDFFFGQNYDLFQSTLYCEGGGGRHVYFFGLYFALPWLFLIFQIICGMSALPDFSCEEETTKRKRTLIILPGSDMKLKMEKEAPVIHSIYLQQTTCRGRLDHRLHAARNKCQLLFSKVTCFPQNLIVIFAATACGHSVSGNLQCQLFAKWLWQGLC